MHDANGAALRWSSGLTVLLACIAAPTSFARPEPLPPGADTCTEDAMIVFDGSGSMQRLAYSGETRMTLARAAADAVVPAAARTRRLGLAVYGPGGGPDCSNFRVRIPPMHDAAAPILAEIADLTTAGETPLTSAVEQSAMMLGWPATPQTIVVVTDGDENCGGDPCALGRRLASAGSHVKVHVVSFRTGTLPRFRAQCLAEETGGHFIPTETLEELVEALSRVLVCPQVAAADAQTLTGRGRTARSTSR
ncbi:MAG: VWA domain-containing protein [Hyphomicrobiaceae bacterium]